MAYEINSNKYTTLKRCQARDTFTRTLYNVDRGTELDSVWASWILVTAAEQELFIGLDQQEGIDKRVELGYLALVV